MTSTVFITFAAPFRVRSRIVLFEVDDWIHRGVVKGEPWPVAAWIARLHIPHRLFLSHYLVVQGVLLFLILVVRGVALFPRRLAPRAGPLPPLGLFHPGLAPRGGPVLFPHGLAMRGGRVLPAVRLASRFDTRFVLLVVPAIVSPSPSPGPVHAFASRRRQ